jgi:hypothetical protein
VLRQHLLPIKGTLEGGGYSTVEDLLNFGNALLGHRLLCPESTELLLAGKAANTPTVSLI